MKKKRYLELFLSTLKLSACTFGGGYVIVALMRGRFVKELGWIDEQEMLDMTAIAQSSPGAVAVNASILVGYHVAGLPGAMVTLVGAVLPPLVIISVISMFYQAFRQNVLVSMIMSGMTAGVAAVVVDVVIGMTGRLIGEKRVLPLLMLPAAFIAVRVLSLPTFAVLLCCAFVGVLSAWAEDGRRKR